jgi:hypothetical protein
MQNAQSMQDIFSISKIETEWKYKLTFRYTKERIMLLGENPNASEEGIFDRNTYLY